LISGHLYGFPKQICDDTPIERLGNQVNAAIKRRGQPLYNIVFVFTSPPVSKREEPEEVKLGKLLGPVPWLQIKKVPSPEKGGKVLKQLVRIDMERQPPAELWGGNASIIFTPNAYYPHLDKLAPKKYLYACYVRPNTILPYGRVIWEEFK